MNCNNYNIIIRKKKSWVFVGKPEERRPPSRHGHRLGCNNKINLKIIAWVVVDWIYLAQDRDKR
jgi:hypothetical protein